MQFIQLQYYLGVLQSHGVWRDETGQYVLKVGQDRELRLFIRVRNRGEDAHEASVNIILPPLMEYLGTDSDVSPPHPCYVLVDVNFTLMFVRET